MSIPVIDVLAHDWLRLRALWYSATRFWGRTRVSISYLFRIRIDGQYLLVKSSRWGHYQPVGGVYKFYETARPALEKLDYALDDVVKLDAVSKNDLRFSVPGWRLWAALGWFTSGSDREIGGWREFHEELISTGILPSEEFATIDFRWLQRTSSKMRHPRQGKHREILVSDILELIPTPTQEVVLRRILEQPPENVLWATAERICRGGAETGENLTHPISDHAQLVLG